MACKFAVLTGDIVDSTALSAAELSAALGALEMAVQDLTGWTNSMVTGFRRRGGDSWQAALSAPQLGLRAALYLAATLRSEDKDLSTRIALAAGDGTLPPDGDTNSASGPAFVASGRLLEGLPRHNHISHASGGALAATTRLADHIAQGWTVAQARAMREMLPPHAGPRTVAAERLGITRQAVNQALWSAGYPALSDALSLVEDGYQDGS